MGLAVVDLLGHLPRYPAANSKNRVTDLSIQGGGPAATACAAAARLGEAVAYLGVVGDDDPGRSILGELAGFGVDVSGVVIAAGGRSPLSFVAVGTEDASRTVFHAPGRLPALDPAAIDWRCLEGAGVLLVDGREPAAQREAVRRAREAGVQVLVDCERLDESTRALVAASDACVASSDVMAELGAGPEEALAALAALGPAAVVITLGEEGAIGRLGRPAAGAPVRQPAFPALVVDTTGCGDAYHGAFAAGMVRGLDLAGCMELAAATAALKCRAPGGRAGLPDRAEVDAFLRRVRS